MNLSQEQLSQVASWVGDGAGLSEVQRRIHDEFGVKMTYMEVRFLVLDIGAAVKDKEEPRPKEPAPAAPQVEDGDTPADEAAPDPDGMPPDAAPQDAPDPLGASNVSVELDKIVRAGAAMSGTVTFSDGVTGSWILDAYGRLALTKVSQPGYQPSAKDLQSFQLELQRKLSGF